MFSPKFLDEYKKNTEPAVVNLIKDLGIKYGNIMFQGFEENGKLYFHESGLRMGGEQFYVFAEKLNGISSLELMIEFALTGKMTRYNAEEQDKNFKSSEHAGKFFLVSFIKRILHIQKPFKTKKKSPKNAPEGGNEGRQGRPSPAVFTQQ